MPDKLVNIIAQIREILESEEKVRDQTFRGARRSRTLSKQAIMFAHNSDLNQASRKLEEVKTQFSEMQHYFKAIPELEFSEGVKAAQEEYAEAFIFLSLLSGEGFLTPLEVGVSPSRYLNGLGDVPGELRREALDALRRGETELAETYFNLMEDIYLSLASCETLSFLLKGLRRKIDVARGVTERTRGDITTEIGHRRLGKSVNQLIKKMDEK
jgi:translin